MLKPVHVFFIGLAQLIGFVFLNIYPSVRVGADSGWGSNGSGLTTTYGFPLPVATSIGCFSGPNFYYGNLLVNLIVWEVVAMSLSASPLLASCLRSYWKAGCRSVRDAFNYGGIYETRR